MNKVVSIEIARQVFWIDEDAYRVLQDYIKIIKQQLLNDPSSDEIFKDIELRIAELLFNINGNDNKAIIIEELNQVVEQIGYIDNEEIKENLPRKSYLDPKHKILGGVCSGLSIRLGAPVFIIRLVFIALTAAFGLGIALYLIFWFSLDTINNRNSALASKGKSATAKHIAGYVADEENIGHKFQKIIFLPLGIISTLFTVIKEHFRNRSKGYKLIAKTLIVALMLFSIIIFSFLLLEFNQQNLFAWPINWLLSITMIFLVVLPVYVIIQKYYINRSYIKLDKRLKIGVVISIFMVLTSYVFLELSHKASQSESAIKIFNLNNQNHLTIKFINKYPDNGHRQRINYQFKSNLALNNNLKLQLKYSSYGKNKENATINMQTIDYFYSFENNQLELSEYFTLEKGVRSRGQQVNAIIEIPKNIFITSSLPFEIDSNVSPYQYKISKINSKQTQYITSGIYIHENTEQFKHKLSPNEHKILNNKFCQIFFSDFHWSCASNIRQVILENNQFDLAFKQDSTTIDKLRKYLLVDRSILTSNLIEMNSLTKELLSKYPMINELNEYIAHLILIKSKPK